MKKPQKKLALTGLMLAVVGFCSGLEIPTDEDYARANGARDTQANGTLPPPLEFAQVEECREPCFVETPEQQASDIKVAAEGEKNPGSPSAADPLIGTVAPTVPVETGPSRRTEWAAVSDEKLGRARGGFDAAPGLAVSFGIVRSVSINGEIVTRTAFNLPDLARITPEQAKAASAALAEANIVQNGPGNVVGANIRSQSTTGTIIQNSLSNQKIQSLTVINTEVNSLGMMKSMNALGVLRDSLFGSAGVR
jgi:hypothetical protein